MTDGATRRPLLVAVGVVAVALALAGGLALGAWLTSVEREIRRDGIDYLRVITGDPLEPALRRFLIGRRGQPS